MTRYYRWWWCHCFRSNLNKNQWNSDACKAIKYFHFIFKHLTFFTFSFLNGFVELTNKNENDVAIFRLNESCISMKKKVLIRMSS